MSKYPVNAHRQSEKARRHAKTTTKKKRHAFRALPTRHRQKIQPNCANFCKSTITEIFSAILFGIFVFPIITALKPIMCQTRAGKTVWKIDPPKEYLEIKNPRGKPQIQTYRLFKENILRYETTGHLCISTRREVQTRLYLFGDEPKKKKKKKFKLPLT